MRFGDVFSKYHPFTRSEELFRYGGICVWFCELFRLGVRTLRVVILMYC